MAIVRWILTELEKKGTDVEYIKDEIKSLKLDFEVVGQQDEPPTSWRTSGAKDVHILIRTKGCALHWVRKELLDTMIDYADLPAPPQACT
jgi:hypothetical protein